MKYLFFIISSILLFNSCAYKNIFNSETIKQLPLEEYVNKIKTTDNSIIIDVRTPAEYNKSHYPNAINVDLLKQFKKDTKELDNTKTVFIYCETAHRSPYAAKFLKQNGFTKIYDLEKGYSQVRKASKNINEK